MTFAIDRDADYRAVDVRTDGTGCDFVAVTPDGRFPARVPLPGRFNVLNALGAWAAARALGAPADGLAASLARRRDRARGASSRSRPASRSASSSTTRTSPTRSSRCCARRASWPPGG